MSTSLGRILVGVACAALLHGELLPFFLSLHWDRHRTDVAAAFSTYECQY